MITKIMYVFIALALITGIARVIISYVDKEKTNEDILKQVQNQTATTTETNETKNQSGEETTFTNANLNTVSPEPYSVVSSPLNVTGKARGNWFFEASFPVSLTNWDGLIIAEGIATTTSDWMTTDFIPFTASLEFVNPYHSGDPDFMKKGTLILKKDNPSGLPEHDDALEIPINFAP